MSCWVVPSLAAEVWQIPLEQLWRRIRDGQVQTKVEGGFTFVDMAPNGPKIQRPMTPKHERPPTFTVPVAIEATDEEMGPPDETESTEMGDWRAGRLKASRTRIPPRRRQRAA